MAEIIWSPRATNDFVEIIEYIAQDSEYYAKIFAQGVIKSIEVLGSFPESGRVVPEFRDPTIREIIHKPCRIVYRLNKHETLVEIARVWHSARGIPEV